jgi:hypothetical protein
MKDFIFVFFLLLQINANAQTKAKDDFFVVSQISKEEIYLAKVGVDGDSFHILNAQTARMIDGKWADYERGGRIQF